MMRESHLELLCQVAHDLNSPLTSLGAVINHCRETGTLKGDFLNLLDLSYKRIQGIAGDLLERRNPQFFSLHEVLDELVEELFLGTSDRIVFRKEYHEAIWYLGIRERLQRAFGNILKNAVESIKGPGTITIQTSVNEDRARISITDTGCSMSPSVLKKISQVGYTTKRDGHGIGITVVREVVMEHGGTVEVKSEAGKGTTFLISLPLPSHSLPESLSQDT